MSQTIATTLVTVLVVLLVALSVLLYRARRQFGRSMKDLNNRILDVSQDVSVGRRLADDATPEAPELSLTLNKLFDALSERDAEIGDRERLFKDFVTTIPEVVLVHDHRIYFANEAAGALVALPAAQLEGRSVTDLVKPAYRAIFRKGTQSLLDTETEEQRRELQMINGREQGLWVEAASRIIDFQGHTAVMTIARDISHRRSLEASLGRSKQFAQFTLESIAEGVVTTDTNGRIDYMNRAAEAMTGLSREDVAGKNFGETLKLVDDTDRKTLGNPVERCLATRQRVNMGRRAMLLGRSADHEHSVELTASPIRRDSGGIGGVVILIHDVSEIRGLTRQMSYQASHDPLTGLINRREFERQLSDCIESARGESASHMLCYLDLDRFKAVNDSCGHQAGDRLLQEIAGILKEKVRDSDSVARIGGDEFALLLVGCPIEKARQIAESVVRAVADYRFVWQNRIFTLGASIGLVEISHSSGSVEETLAAADSACYVAKQRGRGRVEMYSAREETIARERGDIQWLQRIQQALSADGFELASQPIIAVNNDSSGPALEILLRLDDHRGVSSEPREFLVSAERYQLMPEIDRWVVQTTLAALGASHFRLPEGRSVSINLSGQTLGDESFLEFVVDCLDHSAVSPTAICFEVTESALIANMASAQRFIEVLHGMGSEFALDDFGSGLGSFSKLKHLPVDYLKIDGSFTRGLATDAVNQEMVAAMIKLANTMDFRTVAEEVEEQSDFDALRAMGVDFVQGYFIEKPAPLLI